MPPDKIDRLDVGELIEARVAQVRFWEGYFARSGIDLQAQFGAAAIQVTDLDLLAYSFGPNLEVRKAIGESKSGGSRNAPKPLDRIVWLRGLRELVGAEQAELTVKTQVQARVRDLARHLGVTVQSIADLESREKRLHLADVVDTGAYGAEAALLRKRVRASVKDPDLQNAYRFLRSSVWFVDHYAAAKQTLGLIEALVPRWVPKVEDDEKLAVRWLLAEAISVFALNVAMIAGDMSPMSPAAFEQHVSERLADGVVPAAKMRELSRDIDKFVAGLLAAAQAPATLRADAMGAFEPEAPKFAASLAELAGRFEKAPSTDLRIRQVEMLAHERIARRREPSAAVADRLSLDGGVAPAELAALAAFLRTFAGLTPELSAALTTPIGVRKAAGEPGDSGRQDHGDGSLFAL